MKKIAPGVLAGVLAAAVLAAPALGAPANVTVRVEGDATTLVPRSAVATTATPVGKPGEPTCAGTTALGALDLATGGDWTGPYSDQFDTYGLDAIKGESHTAATESYWAFWINHTYSTSGLCGAEVQEGDDLLFVPECYATGCTNSSPLRLSGVPATVQPGATVSVKVDEYAWAYTPDFQSATTSSGPAEDATVTAGGQTVTTGADGTAQLTFANLGPVSIAASKAGRVRTSGLTCVTDGSDGNCGSRLPATAVLGTEQTDDTTAPVASFSGLANGRVFSRRRAPRVLAGGVTPDPSGLLSVRLSIVRKHRGRCWVFDGATERFERRCGGGWRSFEIGDRADWSYLLPRRLPRGRYTLRVVAVDKRGNYSVTKTKIRVR